MNLPETMRAAVLRFDGFSGTSEGPEISDAGDWLESKIVERPTPGEAQVLIKLHRATVNPSDLHFIKGEYGQPRRAGIPAGFEGCGEVVAAGRGELGSTLVGQRVSFVVTPNGSGAWAEYVLTDASSCVPLHPKVSDNDGAAQIVNPLTAVAMIDLAASHTDCVVLTAATSQLCKLMIGLARDRGLRVIAIVRRAGQCERLKQLGASEVLVSGASNFLENVQCVIQEYKPKMLLDAVAGACSSEIFHAMPRTSRWVIYGKLDSAPPVLKEPGQLVFMNKRIEGFWLVNWMRETSAEKKSHAAKAVQDRFVSGQWRTDVSVTVPLGRLVDELSEATKKLDGKVMISPGYGSSD